MHVAFMLFFHLGEDKYIIKVDNTVIVKDALHSLINVPLEYCWCVSKAKQHNKIFIVAVLGAKRYLPLVSSLNQDSIVSVAEIKLSEVLGADQLVHELVNSG
jgi:hypothetical protein